jgi:hypothetical protein
MMMQGRMTRHLSTVTMTRVKGTPKAVAVRAAARAGIGTETESFHRISNIEYFNI